MPWTITESSYKPGPQGIEFVLTDGADRTMFLMPLIAIAGYFHIKQSRDEIIAAFEKHQSRIASFAARTMSNCPAHKNGHKLLSLDFCRAMVL